MDSILKKGVLLVSMTGIMTAFPMVVHAADIDDMQNITAAGSTQILEDCYTSDKTISVKDHLVPEQKGEYSDMAFANVQSFLYIRSEPTTDSEWVGKLYPDYAAKITGPVGEWTKVESGNVTGYVYSRYITVGNEAQKKAEELVQNNDTGNVEDAFTAVRMKGYGVVSPTKEEIILDEPEIIRQGNKYGVKIHSQAPSIHLIRANIETEIAPIVGNEQQAEDLIQYIKNEEKMEGGIWKTSIFGKTVEELVMDGLKNKMAVINEESQEKLQDSMQKIVNDSKGGLVCIII